MNPNETYYLIGKLFKDSEGNWVNEPVPMGWPAYTFFPKLLAEIGEKLDVLLKDKDIFLPSNFKWAQEKTSDYEICKGFDVKLMRFNERHSPSYKRSTRGMSWRVKLDWDWGGRVKGVWITLKRPPSWKK